MQTGEKREAFCGGCGARSDMDYLMGACNDCELRLTAFLGSLKPGARKEGLISAQREMALKRAQQMARMLVDTSIPIADPALTDAQVAERVALVSAFWEVYAWAGGKPPDELPRGPKS